MSSFTLDFCLLSFYLASIFLTRPGQGIKKHTMKTNATINELQTALNIINKKYGGNISFETLEQKTKNRVSFTLKAKSGLPGSRTSHSGRKLPKASWHVHGDFFDALFNIRPDIYIISLGKRIDINGGNWEDANIGSIVNPVYYSETSIF